MSRYIGSISNPNSAQRCDFTPLLLILGCTELPLVFDNPADEQVIDTLKVLSDGLLERYFNK